MHHLGQLCTHFIIICINKVVHVTPMTDSVVSSSNPDNRLFIGIL